MLLKIEHIANSFGKFLLQCLFILAIASNCRACAKIILTKEDNFQCPICRYFKDLRNPILRVSMNELDVFNLPVQEFYVKQSVQENKIVEVTTPKKVEVKISTRQHKEHSITYHTQNRKDLNKHQKQKLYLLYQQIKVGDEVDAQNNLK